MKSKRDSAIEPFFNSMKNWHFDELCEEAKISRPQMSSWLKKFEKEGLIKRIKHKNKMPYYISNIDSPHFQNQKRLFALKKLNQSGLLDHLASLKKAKAVIIFGSFARYDWYKESDIDVFIYGEDNDFEQGRYEIKLGREIQVHNAKDKKELRSIKNLLPYIFSGDFIKGNIKEIGADINA